MHTRLRLIPILLLALAVPSLLAASPIAIGQLIYSNPIDVSQGFMIANLTGPAADYNGCNSLAGYPVCDNLDFTLTTLTVTLQDGTVITRTPGSGATDDFAFAPGYTIYGDSGNLSDNPNQSFEFDAGDDIVSAVFSGTVSPGSFLLADGSTFYSDGTFLATMAVPQGDYAYATADIITDVPQAPPPPTSTVPEPGTLWLSLGGLGVMAWEWRRRRYAA